MCAIDETNVAHHRSTLESNSTRDDELNSTLDSNFTRPAALHDADVISRHLSNRDRLLHGVRVVCSARPCAASSRQAGSPHPPLPSSAESQRGTGKRPGELRRRRRRRVFLSPVARETGGATTTGERKPASQAAARRKVGGLLRRHLGTWPPASSAPAPAARDPRIRDSSARLVWCDAQRLSHRATEAFGRKSEECQRGAGRGSFNNAARKARIRRGFRE